MCNYIIIFQLIYQQSLIVDKKQNQKTITIYKIAAFTKDNLY